MDKVLNDFINELKRLGKEGYAMDVIHWEFRDDGRDVDSLYTEVYLTKPTTKHFLKVKP